MTRNCLGQPVRGRGSFGCKPTRSLIRAFLLARFILGALVLCAVPLHAQRTKADSIASMAKCWRFASPPATPVLLSACPDSVEAMTKMLPLAPVYHQTAYGLKSYMRAGQSLHLRATLIRGFMFLSPLNAPRFGMVLTPADAVKRAAE